MKQWTVTYTQVFERRVTALVEADDEKEAIKKAIDGDVIRSDDDSAPDEWVEDKNEKAVEGDTTLLADEP